MFQGSRMPIVVKLAETPQQKELKQRAKEGSFVQNPYMPPVRRKLIKINITS